MNILVHIAHPAQFHLFRNVITNLEKDGHKCFILIKTKDILEDLVKESGLNYFNILKKEHRGSKLSMFLDLLVREWQILKFVFKHKIEMLIGSSVEIAQVGWLLRKKRVNFGEDDMSVVPLFCNMAGPFIQTMLSPISCNNGKIEPKSIKYAGFHKLAYLHPNTFTPDRKIVEQYFSLDKPFFILRFAKLKAYHDISANAQGINTEIAQKIIDILKPHGNIYITSERKLEPQFEQYRMQIKASDIHHILSFASIYIGDSQSMAVEAAMLGTPSLRFNNFAGKIGVLEELEHTYELTYGISPTEPNKLYDKLNELISNPNLKEIFQQRRKKMLSDKIDVTAFFTWFLENYPASRTIMKENPDFQFKFK